MDPVLGHYFPGHWWVAAIYAVVYGAFIAFLPFYKKSQVKPSGAYLAFVVAFAVEMFGVPMSIYLLTWVLGFTLPDGILWGHTLIGIFGLAPTNIGVALQIIGAAMVILGWREIHRQYWSQERGQGHLVTGGIYRFVRHPQYTGFLLTTLGMIFEWATLPLLIMWPVLGVLYYRLAKKEEADMEQEFGQQYLEYKQQTTMFLPVPRLYRAPAVAADADGREFVGNGATGMASGTEVSADVSAPGTNWRRVGLFVGATFALTWLLELGIYLTGGLSSSSQNQAILLLFQIQMLIPAATAIALGFFFRGSPQRASRGQARRFFLFFLAYFVAWLALGVVALATRGQIPSWLPICQLVLLVIGLPALLILRFAGGRSAFAQAGLKLGSPWIWLLGGTGLFLYRVVQAWFNTALGLGQSGQIAQQAAQAGQPVAVYVAVMVLEAMVLGPILGLVITFGEEYGWRGLLQGELVKLGRVRGVLLVGLIWGVWHAPVVVMGGNYPGYPAFGPFVMISSSVVMGFFLGYAVLKTGSIWVAALLHAVNNQTDILLSTLGCTPNDPVFSFGFGLYALVIGAVIVLLILRDPVWRGEARRAQMA
jgi:protein-S-isoprenylcysteine O-methyltransferase Ste14/membrane protease YdiL (CAAX protease family)